ncbi:MAG TPA: alpha/beta hydrolase [Thermoleophilaceae bacterium]|jgi:pimeloyl-ACP methyl ester carboxylesterase|nr:alpha/beta hydrolase [Thermoleophilaceae bacterium]
MNRAFLLTAIAVAAAVTLTIVLSTTGAPATENTSSTVERLRQCRSGDSAPTVVLVHGAWADASSWAGEVRMLQRAGVRVRAIANPVEDLTTDARYVADFLQTIRGPIVLVGHSYGGAVITNAAAGHVGVKALVYVDAAAPAPGETNGQLSGSRSVLSTGSPATLYKTVPRPSYAPGAHELYLRENVFVKDFANDLPRTAAVRLWASQRGASTAAFMTPSRTAAWKTIPSWFFVSTGDRIITPASQLAMARRARAHVTTFRGGSHLTLISHPEAVAAVIASAICDTTR